MTWYLCEQKRRQRKHFFVVHLGRHGKANDLIILCVDLVENNTCMCHWFTRNAGVKWQLLFQLKRSENMIRLKNPFNEHSLEFSINLRFGLTRWLCSTNIGVVDPVISVWENFFFSLLFQIKGKTTKIHVYTCSIRWFPRTRNVTINYLLNPFRLSMKFQWNAEHNVTNPISPKYFYWN